MRLLRRLFRLLRLLPHLARGLWLAGRRMPADPPPRTAEQWRLVRWWHRRTLELLGIDVRIHGDAAPGPVLFVANHVSWLDISVLLTVIDAGFVGKGELRDWPILGLLIRRGGTIFIERGARGAASSAVTEMSGRLEAGHRAAVFPEGTTSHGDRVARFHPRLFDAALRTAAAVQPVALCYNRRSVAYTDDESFISSLWRILGERGLAVDVHLLPEIDPQAYDRRGLAETAQRQIAAQVCPAGEAISPASARSTTSAAPEQG